MPDTVKPSKSGRQARDGQKILVVEDEQLVAMYLADLLEEFGYEVSGTVSAMAQALEAAAAQPPALALVDVALARGEDGIAVARELADRFGTSIIFLTGANWAGAERQMARIRPIAILSKPCNHEELAEAINRALAKRQR